MEHRFGLTTITGLLAVVTPLSLGEERSLLSSQLSSERGKIRTSRAEVAATERITHLAGLVLGDLVLGVLPALLALAVGLAGLGNVDLSWRKDDQHSSIRHIIPPVQK